MLKFIGLTVGFAGGLVALLLLSLLLSAPIAGIVMVLLGIAHGFNEIIPPLGFLETWMIVMALRLSVVSSNSSQVNK